MFLKYVQIVNFRNLKDAKFCFAEGANTIIGENDAGKSNAVTAMRILLDSDYYYNTKRLKDTDFSFELGDWKGHWIIISAFFDKITPTDKETEVCSEMIPDTENLDFLKSFIRCRGFDYGVVTLFIRPNKKIRLALHNAADKEEFDRIRNEIKISDYEFVYTSRSQADFTLPEIYNTIVGNMENGTYADPENMDSSLLGTKIEILDVWSYISMVFVDALRDVEAELCKPKNPIRRIVDAIQTEIDKDDLETIQSKIRDLNQLITEVEQISDIGFKIGSKMDEIIGLVYAPDIKLESCIKEDISSVARNLTIELNDQHNIELLGLGHLNMLYVALKLVEFEYNRDHEVINIMVVEEPEAHIHTHIQKTLFNNLRETTANGAPQRPVLRSKTAALRS